MRYRAFLSYSHADSEFVERFHKDLERWRAGRGLAGRDTRFGPVPRDLRPIFRDRDDFAGGGALEDATNEALEASDFLIVICSPASARSAYVNEEIRSFKAMGGSDRIIPVIIAGEPGDPDENCFPDALIYKVDDEGVLTDEVEDRLAADARSVGDGPRRALAKVIAGLLGVSFDEIVRRAELAQRRRNRIFASVAAVMSVLALLAAGFGWLAELRRVEAEQNYQAAMSAADSLLGEIGEELIRIEGVSLKTTKRILGRAESVYDRLMAARPLAQEVKAGKVAALGVFARAYYDKGDLGAARAAAGRAEALTRELVAQMPDTPAAQVPLAMMRAEQARLLISAGDRDAALDVLESSLAVLSGGQAARLVDNSMANYVVGVGIQLALLSGIEGKTDRALEVMALVDRIAAERQGATGGPMAWPAVRASALATRGAIEEERGDLDAAFDLMERAIADLRTAVADEPDRPQVRVLLANTLRAAGSLSEKRGQPDRSKTFIAEADALLKALAAADAEDVTVQAAAAARAAEQAAARIEDGDVAAGVAELRRELDTLLKAAGSVPKDALNVDGTRQALRKAVVALSEANYPLEALDVAKRLVSLERGTMEGDDDLEGRKRLAFALTNASNAAESDRQFKVALDYAEEALALERELAELDTSRLGLVADAEWQSAAVLWQMSRREEAEARFARLVSLFAELSTAEPTNRYYGSSLTWTCVNLGELMALNGKGKGATSVFERCILAGERMLAALPNDRGIQIDMAWAEARVALATGDAERWRRVIELLKQADAAEPLRDLEEELLTVAHISLAKKA